MIFGISIEILNISEFEKQVSLSSEQFLTDTFTDRELEYCEKKRNKAQNYAARFAAKQAFHKAIGSAAKDKINYCDIEIINDELGKPIFQLFNNAKKISEDFLIKTIHVTLSHVKEMVVAVVILET